MYKIIKIIPISGNYAQKYRVKRKKKVLLALKPKEREAYFCWKNQETLYEDSSIWIRTWSMDEDTEEVQAWDGRLKSRQWREYRLRKGSIDRS